jgi:hypothetical protein
MDMDSESMRPSSEDGPLALHTMFLGRAAEDDLKNAEKWKKDNNTILFFVSPGPITDCVQH